MKPTKNDAASRAGKFYRAEPSNNVKMGSGFSDGYACGASCQLTVDGIHPEAPMYKLYSDIVEDNGKTIRENNLEKQHDLPVGTLVEVKYDEFHGDGACSKVHARLWVALQGRDCDGTPLYWLSPDKPPYTDEVRLYYPEQGIYFNAAVSRSIVHRFKGGFARDRLTVVEVTERLAKGYGVLEWANDEKRGSTAG